VSRIRKGHNSARFARWGAGMLTAMLAMTLAIPVAAGADVLPDGRVYEQVSPVKKNGFDAGAPGGDAKYAVAMADGNGLLYGVRGPMGTVHRGIQDYSIGRRGVAGWSSESALPGGSQERIFLTTFSPSGLFPSSDLNTIVFSAGGSYVPDNPVTLTGSSGLYEGHADGTVDWLSRPQIANPVPPPGSIPNLSVFQAVGGSPDLSTLYIWSGPTLIAEDAARASGPGWGLYEYSGGVLKPAGTLPDGTEDPGGAAPASSETSRRGILNVTSPETTSHQVSRDGTTLLFVSPDPGPDPGASGAVQLYVRRDGRSTLVSHLPDGTAAPSGVAPVQALNTYLDGRPHMYAYGSADGATVIFQSVDALAAGAPNDGSQKAYRYDVATDTVSYLAGVSGTVVAASDDDQRFLTGGVPGIALWDHGTTKTIAPGPVDRHPLAPARATASGSVFLFTTDLAIPGFNSGGFIQVYRYDVADDKLRCLSCPPDGVASTGDARLSNQDSTGPAPSGELVASRGMSDDGRRVFFDTPASLVSRDANGRRDVYEWTKDGLSLISSGRSQQDSIFMDNSADGDDVFFATSEGLDPVDADGEYDVYDARVGGGFAKAVVAAPCTGDGCQGAVSGAAATPTPGSAVFSGAGDEHVIRPDVAAVAKLKLGSRRVLGSMLEVTATVTGSGRVSVTGNGLRSVTKSYTKSGTLTLKVPLTVKAKRLLKAKRRLKLSVRVGLTPKSGTTSSVKFVLNAKA
jgi:hypothetical protein